MLPDFNLELDKCELHSGNTSSAVSERDEDEMLDDDEYLDELKMRVKELAIRPIEGKSTDDPCWESELKSTVDKLDHMMLMKERAKDLNNFQADVRGAKTDGDS